MGKKKLPENMAQVASNSLEELANFTETNESAAESEQQAYQPTNNNGIADKYLSNNGFDPSKATTGGSGATITAGKADSFIERMREAFDRNEKIMYPHSHRHRQQLPQAYQDKVATLKDLMNKQMRDSLDFLDTGLATDSRKDILTEQAAMKLVSRFPNKGGILSKDSVILNNAPVARMIAGFQNLVIEQMFEDTELAVMLCRQVGTMEAAGFGKEGFTNFGRAYAYRLGYADNGASKPTGPNRRNFNSPRGVSVIGEIRLTNEWKQIVLDTDFAAAFRWAMLDFWFLSQQSGTGYDILAQAWLRLRERLLRSMNQYLLRNFYNQISEAGAIARIETVASVAPGASNGHYHIGEYVAITNQTNVTIGGVVVPVANTNIGAIVRVRGGNTSGEAFLNVPIVEPRNAQEIDQNGVFIDNPLNELKVQIGESQDGFLLPGILHNGNICKYNSDDELVAVGSNEKYYATNSGNGLVFISSGANPPATPAGSGANRVIVHYSQETNFSYFNQDITGKKQGEVANKYYRYIAKQAGQTMGSQFISPDTLLTDNQFGAFLQGGTVFENQASPKGAVLNSLYTPGSLVANYGDITFLQNNTPRNNLENKNYENVDILMTAGRIMFATAPFFPSEPYKLPGVEGGNTVANQQWGIDMTTSMGIQVPRHVDAMGNTVNFPFKLIRRLGPNTVQDHYLG